MKENEISVLLCITIDKYGDYFILDSKEYSNFPDEKEVLIQEGKSFEVISKKEIREIKNEKERVYMEV